MKNALFLQPLPEQSSVPPACQSIQGKTYSVQNASTSSGVFTSATIPESLVARPPEERAVVPESMASVSAGKEGSSRATEEAEKQTRGRKDQLSNLPDDADEVCWSLKKNSTFFLNITALLYLFYCTPYLLLSFALPPVQGYFLRLACPLYL